MGAPAGELEHHSVPVRFGASTSVSVSTTTDSGVASTSSPRRIRIPRRMALGSTSSISQMRRNEKIHLQSLLRTHRKVSRSSVRPFEVVGGLGLQQIAIASSKIAAIRRCSPVQAELRWSWVKNWTGRMMWGSNKLGSSSSDISRRSRVMQHLLVRWTTVQPVCHPYGRHRQGLFPDAGRRGRPPLYNLELIV